MEAASLHWRPLGELFVSRGLISEAELETALAEQAATGKRLGEILVERGLVSGPDLTSALMDQLGVEIAKEEGFGSGLWSEIKRRHKRDRLDGASEEESEEGAPRPVLTEAIAEGRQSVGERSHENATDESEPEPEAGLEDDGDQTLTESRDPDFDQELEEMANDYASPAPFESQYEPDLDAAPAPVPEVERDPERVPAATMRSAPEPMLQLDVVGDDAEHLRAELARAREDLAHIQGMLADAMTALAALTAEAQGVPYES